MASVDLNLRLVERLIETLASDDAFVRREAIEELALLTQQRLGFRWCGDAHVRDASVARWKKWLAKANKQRRRQKAGLDPQIKLLSGGAPVLEQFQKQIEHLPTEQKEALVAQLMEKLMLSGALGQNICEACGERPATVKVTLRRPDGSFVRRASCERCLGSLS